ncbi:FAD-binding oxidoreductase [Streptosporangium sp. KLBMP 9127]|nr:FAD-binding oxidoreductase [Streptosporangium sp. KLBMP 9127]
MSTRTFTEEINTLAGRVAGPVFRPGDDGYDAERTGYQTGFRHRPDMIVGALGAQDVRAAVEFAAAHRLPVAVQAAGHGLTAAAEGGLLISTRRMNGVRVDPGTSTAWIEAGATWGEVVSAAARHGLAPLSGSSLDVGAVPYTLGGGLGLLARRYGYAADHVHEIDIVTADGRLRHVTARRDPELFHALCGGRDGLGVVTGLRAGLVPVTRLYGGSLFFDAERVPDLLPAYLRWTATVPEELTSAVSLIPFPDLPAFPEPFRGRRVAGVQIAFTGDAAAGERLVAPLRAAGPYLLDTLRDLPYTESGSIHDEPHTPHAYHGDNAMLSDLDAETLATVARLTGPDAPVMCIVGVRHLGGALARPPVPGNAVAHRDARYLLQILSPLDAPGGGLDAVLPVHRRVLDVVTPWTLGRSPNFVFGERRTGAHGPGDPRRTALKAIHDPAGIFDIIANVDVEASASAPTSQVSDAREGAVQE